MSHSRFVVGAFVASLLISACGSEPPPPPPPQPETPTAAPQPDADSLAAAQARADSIRDARAHEAAVARAVESLEALVFFDYDEASLTDQAQTVLRSKVDILRASLDVQIRISGHADDRGSTEYNLALGNRRAQSVREYFESFGLAGSRFTTVSFGEERPIDMGTTEASYARNRRAAFEITAGRNMINPPME